MKHIFLATAFCLSFVALAACGSDTSERANLQLGSNLQDGSIGNIPGTASGTRLIDENEFDLGEPVLE